MENQTMFITAKEVATICGISISKAYKFIAKCNKELEDMGKLTMAGRTNRKYFMEKLNV